MSMCSEMRAGASVRWLMVAEHVSDGDDAASDSRVIAGCCSDTSRGRDSCKEKILMKRYTLRAGFSGK